MSLAQILNLLVQLGYDFQSAILVVYQINTETPAT